MKIESLKDLKALIKLCRTTGIESIEVDGVKLSLKAGVPQEKPQRKQRVNTYNTTDGTADVSDVVDMPDELTQEQMLFYSAVPNGEQ